MKLTLTNYGKRVLMTAGVIMLALFFVLGIIVCLFSLAHVFGINQQAYNVLFVMSMPLCGLGGEELLSKLAQ